MCHTTFAQCDCSELLKYGLYNHFATTSKVSNYASVSSSLSDAYNKEVNQSTGAGGSYSGLGATFSQSQGKSINKLVTSNSFSESDGNELISTSSAYISPEMVSAYKECLALCNKSGLAFKANIPNDNLARTIQFTMVYTPTPFTKRLPKVKNIMVSPAGCYTCSGSIATLKADSTQRANPHEPYTLTCERKIVAQAFKQIGSDNTYVRANDALISIETDMGQYTVRIPPLYSIPELNSRVGEIIASMLSPDKFALVYGSDWVLADGRPVPDNSRYKAYVGPNAPDLRGVFLRGRNYDRPPTDGNPSGDTPLGTYQVDELKSHDHGYTVYNDKIPRTGGSTADIWRNDKPARTTPTGGLETRPRNVTVNYYIRIN